MCASSRGLQKTQERNESEDFHGQMTCKCRITKVTLVFVSLHDRPVARIFVSDTSKSIPVGTRKMVNYA